MKHKPIIIAVIVSIGFLGLALSGWNPYTGFLFVLTMFLAGTSLPSDRKQPKEKFQKIVSTLQGLAILGVVVTAAWLSGQETFFRITTNPLFLFLCWLWVQLVIIERFHHQKAVAQQIDSADEKNGAADQTVVE